MKSKNHSTANCGTNLIATFVQADGKPMHPNATLLISQNIKIAVVATQLGHAQITTTLNFYVHPVVSHNKVAENVLENLLIPPKTLKMNS